MHARRLLAIARKELRHVVRDLRILFLVTLSPALLGVTFSYVFSFDVGTTSMALLDLDKSRQSRHLVAALTSDGDFRLTAEVSSYEEIDALLLEGSVDFVLIIPRGFSSDVLRGQPAAVQAIIDGLDTISARTAAGYLEARTAAFFGSVVQWQAASLTPPPVQVRTRTWYNPTLESLTSMVPGIVAVVLQMPALALALSLSREKESGSFESLVTTPVRGVEYLIGKLATYMCCGMLSSLLALAVAVFWFRVPFRGSVPVFLLVSAVFFLASMGLGLLVGNTISSQQTAMISCSWSYSSPASFCPASCCQ